MDRREMLGLIAAGTAGLTTFSGRLATAEAIDGPKAKVLEDCLKACKSCAEICEETFHHCFSLVEQGKKEHAKAAQFALDCADFCGLSAKMMARQSEMMAFSCQACGDSCKKCGDECAKFDSAFMKKCVDACRECEKTCHAMLEAMGAGHHHE